MLSDLKFAFRSLAKSPGFTAVALLTLALGIGVNTSMFTVTNTMLLQPLPFADPGRLVRVYRTSPQSQNWPHAVANFLDLKAQSHGFSHLAAYVWSSCNYAAPGQPAERLRGMDATADFFPMLGIAPELGRTFAPEETRFGAAPVVVLSHECWEKRFAGDRGIIGRQIRIDGALATVVGVMPSSFVPRLLWGPVELWRPLNFSPKQEQNRENNFMSAIGRLAPGVSLAQAQAELSGIAARLTQAYPLTNSGNGLRLAPYTIQPDGAPRQLDIEIRRACSRTRIGLGAGPRPGFIRHAGFHSLAQIAAADLARDQRHRHRPFQALGEHHVGEPQGKRLALRHEAQAGRRNLCGGRDGIPLPGHQLVGLGDDILERVAEAHLEQRRQPQGPVFRRHGAALAEMPPGFQDAPARARIVTVAAQIPGVAQRRLVLGASAVPGQHRGVRQRQPMPPQ